MKTDVINPNSSSFEPQSAHEVGGTKKIFTYSGSSAEALLASATTAYADNDIVAYAGALDSSVPNGYHTSSKILIFVSGNARTDRTGAGDTIGYYRIWKTVGGSSSAVRGSYFGANSVTHTTGAWNYMHVDSPNTTSEITYFVKMKVVNTTTVYWSYAAEASTITVMEIAA